MNRARWLTIARHLLVIGANGRIVTNQVVRELHGRAMDRVDPVKHFTPGPISIGDVLWTLPLVIGIALEFTSYRAARVWNIAMYALFGVFMAVGLVLASNNLAGLSEPEHWVLAVIYRGIPAVLFAGVLWWLYGRTNPGEHDVSVVA